MCTGLILDPKLDFVTHKMDVNHQPQKAYWPRIKVRFEKEAIFFVENSEIKNGSQEILDEFQLYSSTLREAQYRD